MQVAAAVQPQCSSACERLQRQVPQAATLYPPRTQVLQQASFAHCPRLDIETAALLPGEQPQAYDLWKRLWPRTDLSHIHLFPSWESEVQQILHVSFAQLTNIFSHYCKANWTPDDAEESTTMDPTLPLTPTSTLTLSLTPTLALAQHASLNPNPNPNPNPDPNPDP